MSRTLLCAGAAALLLAGTARAAAPNAALAAEKRAAAARAAAAVEAERNRPPPPTPQAAAPIDLTGYWVSVVTEAWRFRMVTPAKGDYAGIPFTRAGLQAADRWNPEADKAAGPAALCKAYGGAAMLNMPGRLRIAWEDPNTLKVEMDNGQQTRLLRFGSPPADPGPRSLQGYSRAEWVNLARSGGKGPGMGTLKVTTTNLAPGYLRKNGVQHTENAVVTEYWDLHQGVEGKPWLVVTIQVEDPAFLVEPYTTSPNFKQEPDGSKWAPEPCSID